MSAGFSFFPEMRSDGRGSSAISRRGSRYDDVVNSRRKNLFQLDAKQCPIQHRSVRKKLRRIKPAERNFFSAYFCSRRVARRASLPLWM